VKAVILVGGEGTRLRPLTYEAPKQMLPIVGVAMLERVVGRLVHHGVTEAILSLGYLPDRFIAAYPTFELAGVPVSYAVEPEPLDTAGAIRFAADHGKIDDTFLVVNGDVLSEIDVTRLLNFHKERRALATISLHPVEDPSRFGVVPTDADGRVLDFVEKPPKHEAPTNEINAGFYIMEPEVLDTVAPGERVNVERVTFPKLAADGRLFALRDDSYWLDTGTPQAYLTAHADVLSGRHVVTTSPPVANGSWIHDTATIASSASVTASSVDRSCRVGDGAVVESSVLLPGCVIEEGAIVRDAIIGWSALVGAGATITDVSVIGAGVKVDARGTVAAERIGGPR
jgi:mannose-1-phosphate guanylyltransferase